MNYDVAIIGAGPSGATLARILGEKMPERRILIVDAQTDKNPKVCGGLLSECAQKLFARFDMVLPSEILVSPQIFAVDVIDLATGRERRYQKHYLNMDRAAFDRWLISLLPGNVDIVNGRCREISKDGEKFKLTVTNDSITEIYRCDIAVGADGAASFVRKKITKRAVRKYTSIQEWYRCEDKKQLPRYSCIYDKKTSESCSWTIRKGEYFIYGGAFKTNKCRDAFEKQKARLTDYLGCEFGEPIRTEACLVCSPKSRRDFVHGKDGIFLIGEAAGFISANSYEGISNAMLSAKLLADALKKADLNKSAALRYYKRASIPLLNKMKRRIAKNRVLSSHFCRNAILASGISSIKKFD